MDDDGAARWAILLDSGSLTPEQQAEFDAWLAADERREGSLLRAEAALVYLDRGRALAGASQAAPPHPSDTRSIFSRRGFLVGSALAGTVAVGVTGLSFIQPSEEIATAVGEVRRLPLADGSVATVNTASRLAIAMQPERRQITLEDGEAWFEVAHDAERPFVVDAGDVRVQAIGTAFSVRRHADGVDVLVTKGMVETWRVGRESERTRVGAGERTFVARGPSPVSVQAAGPEIERALAWRSGGLALDGEPLAYAVAELNRYNRHQLVIVDAALGRRPIVGYFRTSEPENFARSVAVLLDAQIETRGEQTRLISKAP
ncbi:FecR family protein [Sphingomonas gilva]|nr:FecR domain-containing protein [Sphingomonas gilva]